MKQTFIYCAISSLEERECCELELQAFLQTKSIWAEQYAFSISEQTIDIARSAYIKWSLQVWDTAKSTEELKVKLSTIQLTDSYRLHVLPAFVDDKLVICSKQEQRTKERELSAFIQGEANLQQPMLHVAIWQHDDIFYVGKWQENKSTWQLHTDKPRQYSTALSTRLARTVFNIAMPNVSSEMTFVDPCCGIGTVLLEAASTGVKATGYDINPLAVIGARENAAHYQYPIDIKIKDMREIQACYDAAVLDLPYNHCSVLSEQEKAEMLSSILRIAKRVVIVSVEPLQELLIQLGANITAQGVHRKANFSRDIYVCDDKRRAVL